MVYIGADHGGYKYKEKLKDYLQARGYKVEDMGTSSEEPADYPLIAKKVAGKVVEDPNNRGIILCRSGAGVCIVANKFDGVRAAEAWTPAVVKSARNDDNVNVLCLAADFVSLEEAKKIAQTFLDTSFGGQERYKRRLKEIEDIEKEASS